MEPDPANVSGAVVQNHSYEHIVRWDYLVFGLLALFVVSKLLPRFTGDDTDDERGVLQ